MFVRNTAKLGGFDPLLALARDCGFQLSELGDIFYTVCKAYGVGFLANPAII
ncbi:MAG: hypothetical protein RMY29_030850 [Nostoc sp. CreGUA01]|nr:hypothetical protein [Nostoc sp. CreGUA01]